MNAGLLSLFPGKTHRQSEPASFIDVVRAHSERAPDSRAFTFLKNGEVEESALTFAMLDEQARAVAAVLQGNANQGDRIILLFPSGLNFIVAFLGCMYAGAIAIPVGLPRKQQGLEKLQGIAVNSGASLVLTDCASVHDLSLRFSKVPELAALKLLAIESILDVASACASEWQPPELDRSSIAFLQYTSGSTGKPKGIAITHGNLLENERMISDSFGHGPDTIVVGWLPFHHDMGLVGNIMNPMYLGVPCVLMSPVAFTQQPISWLHAISKYRATTSGAPNFAYDLCVKRISDEQMQGLDLSSWRLAFCGAEPVRADTLRRFSEKFASVGFSGRVFYPCYGMAEATLIVSGGVAGTGPVLKEVSAHALEAHEVVVTEDGEDVGPCHTLVSCGFSLGDERILIVNPGTGRRCPDGVVGEMWVQGSNVACGYWNNDAATKESFEAYLADSKEGPFLRTGDLGFLDKGQLFVTGRRKEMIIIKGRKFYPHDIEDWVSASHPVLQGGSAAAFGIDVAGEERLIVVHEIARRRLSIAEAQEITAHAREAVTNSADVRLHDLALVVLGGVPRTSSGKKQRYLCRDFYREGKLPFVELRQ